MANFVRDRHVAPVYVSPHTEGDIKSRSLTSFLMTLSLVVMMLVGCTLNTGDSDDTTQDDSLPPVQIAESVGSAPYRQGVGVNIQAAVSNLGAPVETVRFEINGTEFARDTAPERGEGALFTVERVWTAGAPGTYTVRVQVDRTDGSTFDDTATLTVVSAQAVQQPDTNESDSTTATSLPSLQTNATAAPRPTSAPQPTTSNQPVTSSAPQAVFTQNQNVRTGPGTNFTRLGTFNIGDRAEILATNRDGSWYRIEFQGQQAWVYAPLVTLEGSTAGLNTEVGPPTPIPPPTQVPTAVPPPTNPPPPTQAPVTANLVVENFSIVVPSDGSVQPKCGVPFIASVTVRNTGEATTSTGVTRIENRYLANGSVNGSSNDALIPVDILPGGTHTVEWSFTITTNFDEVHRVVFIADANNQIVESNESDNQNGITYTLERAGC